MAQADGEGRWHQGRWRVTHCPQQSPSSFIPITLVPRAGSLRWPEPARLPSCWSASSCRGRSWRWAIGCWRGRSGPTGRRARFANGAMFWSYEAAGIARFGLMALLAGWRWCGRRGDTGTRRRENAEDMACRRTASSALPTRRVAVSFIALLILDLWLFGHGFNTAADPKLLDFKPPVVQWLQDARIRRSRGG